MDQPNSGISLIDLFEISLPSFAMGEEDLSLVICNKKDSFEYQYTFVAGNSAEKSWLSPNTDTESVYIFPLYLKDESKIKIKGTNNIYSTRNLNLNQEIVSQISTKLSLPFTPEKEEASQKNSSPVCYANSEELSEDFKIDLPPQCFAPIDLLDYIYAVLSSTAYNEKYKESLEKDFPVIPYPPNQFIFWKFARLGAELRKLHLLKNQPLKDEHVSFPVQGNNQIKKIHFEGNYEILNGDAIMHITPFYPIGRVYINQNQFFQRISKFAWEMRFGHNQPAKKWLQERKGTILNEEGILTFQRIIAVLTETDRIRNEIDRINF